MRRDMARILPVLVLVVFVFLLGGSCAAQQTADAGTSLWSVWPGKLVYRPGEEASFKVVVRNDGDKPADVRVRCELRSELDDTTPLFDKSVTVGARDYEEMLGTWKAGHREYGYEIRAQLSVKGNLRETKREYFAVGQKKHLLLLGQNVTGQSIYTPPSSEARAASAAPAGATPSGKPALPDQPPTRDLYSIWLDHMWVTPGGVARMAPPDDYPDDKVFISDQSLRVFTKRDIFKIYDKFQKPGGAVEYYLFPAAGDLDGAEMIRRHPRWATYVANGHLWSGYSTPRTLEEREYLQKTMEKFDFVPNAEHQAIAKPEYADEVRKAVGKTELGGDWWQVCLNFATTDPLKHVVSEIIRTKRQLGIDGIRFDGYPWVWTPECARACGASPDFYNSDGGELCKGEDADDLTLRALQYLKDEVGKAYPDFLWGANGLRWGEAPIMRRFFPKATEYFVKDGGWLLWETEGLLGGNTTKYRVLYDASAEDVDWVRPLNGAISAGPFYWSDINPAMFNHVYGMVLSAGCRIWFGIWRPYTQFALRYGALLYDDKIKHVTADQCKAEVAGSRDIWWKERIYDRPIEHGRRQTIIHLLNAPVEECVTRAKYTPPPPVQEGVRVSLERPAGMVLEKAYAMRPEIPQPWKDTSERTSNQDPGFQRADFIKDSRLEASQSGSRIAVSVPRLEYWTMVVFQWKPWGG